MLGNAASRGISLSMHLATLHRPEHMLIRLSNAEFGCASVTADTVLISTSG